jgi:dTDP-4-amino-4,6-dideoxygalactose transaminase
MRLENLKLFDEISGEIREFLDQDFYVLNTQSERFEKNFAEFSKVSHCIGTSSGTTALQILLKNAPVTGGKRKVLVTAFCPIPTLMAIIQSGYEPAFVDIDINTFNISVETLKKAYTKDCAIVLPVHIFGKVCNVESIWDFCQENELVMIEDACQAVGSSTKTGVCPGQLGFGAAMSFYPTKNLGAWGDAGAILTNSSECAHLAQCFRNYGLNQDFQNEMVGTNYRLDALQALVLDRKLPQVSKENKRRKEVFERYREHLLEYSFQHVEEGEISNFHVISCLASDNAKREEIRGILKENKYRARFFYEAPVFSHKSLHSFETDLPNTMEVCSRIFNLPVDSKAYDAICSLLGK